MNITETGGITNEPKMIIHLSDYETEKLQSGEPVQLHTGIGDSVHKTVEVRSEGIDSLDSIEREAEFIQDNCYYAEPMYDDAYEALEVLVKGIQSTNEGIMYGNEYPVVEAYEDFISDPDVQDAIESYWYYRDALEEYR